MSAALKQKWSYHVSCGSDSEVEIVFHVVRICHLRSHVSDYYTIRLLYYQIIVLVFGSRIWLLFLATSSCHHQLLVVLLWQNMLLLTSKDKHKPKPTEIKLSMPAWVINFLKITAIVLFMMIAQTTGFREKYLKAERIIMWTASWCTTSFIQILRTRKPSVLIVHDCFQRNRNRFIIDDEILLRLFCFSIQSIQ